MHDQHRTCATEHVTDLPVTVTDLPVTVMGVHCGTSRRTAWQVTDQVRGWLVMLAQVGNFLLQHKQEGQKENVDLHSLSAKEARAAVLCILCNIQVCQAFPLHAAQI